jgi:hypothetical protein
MSRAAGAIFWLAVAAWGAQRPPELVDLVDRAQGVPAEFAADALLRIADSPKLTDTAWKQELIEEAFRSAASAQQPYARRAWSETRADRAAKAYEQGLDTCSLQCRAVHAMLALDPRKARELFSDIVPPKLPRLTCEDPLAYDVSIFYVTLGELAQQAFTPKEIAEGKPVRLLDRFVGDLSSPAQAPPIARMLAGASLKPDALEGLVNTFAGALRQLSGDDRSFTASMSEEDALGSLVEACTRQKISPVPLEEAWRAYLVRQLSGERCADTAGPESAPAAVLSNRAPSGPDYSGPAGPAQFFNAKTLNSGVKAITADEIHPSKISDTVARSLGACDSDDCKKLGAQYSKLLLGPLGLAYTEEQKMRPDWADKLQDFLAALEAWKCDTQTACFWIKSRFYRDLFEVIPRGPARDTALRSLLGWLEQNNYQRDHRVEWFYPVNLLIIRAFADPAGMKATMRELRNSADPVIALYAQLEQVLPRPPDRTVPLM